MARFADETRNARTAPRISVFPKCWFDDWSAGPALTWHWIREAATLGGEGVEHYDGCLRSSSRPTSTRSFARWTKRGRSRRCSASRPTSPIPIPTNAAPGRAAESRDRSHRSARRAALPHVSGQRYPGMTRDEGIPRTLEGIRRSLEYADKRGVVLCMENHYKDGTWRYPEFAQPEDIFLEIIAQIESPSLRRAVRSVECGRRRLRSGRVPREGQAPGRHHARVGSLPRAGRHAGRTAADRRRDRLRGRTEARRDR